MELLKKMVNFHGAPQVVLLGVGVTDLVSDTSAGIQKWLQIGGKRKVDTGEPKMPSDWDENVFKSLPEEIQKELLSNSSQEVKSPVKKKQKGNSILNYVTKK